MSVNSPKIYELAQTESDPIIVANAIMAQVARRVQWAMHLATEDLHFTAVQTLRETYKQLNLEVYEAAPVVSENVAALPKVAFIFKKSAPEDYKSFVLGWARKVGTQLSISSDRTSAVFAVDKDSVKGLLEKNKNLVDCTIELVK